MPSIIVAYDRTSPIHMPRRDLVLSASDSLVLSVTVVESEILSAQVLEVSTGIGAPALRFDVWGITDPSWDYGFPQPGERPLWSGQGSLSDTALGTFDVFLPAGVMLEWPARCGFSIVLGHDMGKQGSMLAWGRLHIRGGTWSAMPPVPVLTDESVNVLVNLEA